MKNATSFMLVLLLLVIVSCEDKKVSDGGDPGTTPDGDETIGDMEAALPEKNEVGDTDEGNDEMNEANTDDDALLVDEDELISGDSDGDGIPDGTEKPNGIAVDTDKDGTPDYLDADSDGDGIFDSEEGAGDDDGDGTLNYRDTDSDGDGLPDMVEAGTDPSIPRDSDGDGTPDYRDADSDGDGILDLHEGVKDADGDDTPNCLDPDSDGDDIPDCVEKYGALFRDTDVDGHPDCKAPHDYEIEPADTDDDGHYDFLDLDADGDGLPDEQEAVCPNLQKDGRVWADVDDDGFSDLAERAVGSKVCDAAQGVTDMPGIDFYFELPYQGPEKTDILTFTPSVQKADIFFNVDTTGSMDGEIYNLKHSLSSLIIPQVRARVTDSAFGVAQFRDEDETNLILCDPTSDIMAAQLAVNGLNAEFGGDCPEAGVFSLYHLATSGGWRSEAIPIAVHITDAPSHERGADAASALAALTGKGIRVITVFSTGGCDSTTAEAQLSALSEATHATVPECAGAGRTTLKYTVDENGNGLDTAVVNGIDALVRYAAFDVFARPDDDGDAGTIDTACFLKKVEALAFLPPPGDDCAPTATPAALNGASYENGFTNFVTGTSNPLVTGSTLTFTVHAENDTCAEPLDHAQAFTAVISIVDAGSGAVLDEQKVTIIVPGVVGSLNES